MIFLIRKNILSFDFTEIVSTSGLEIPTGVTSPHPIRVWLG